MSLHSRRKCIQLLVIMCSLVWLFITLSDRYLTEDQLNVKTFRPKGSRSLIRQIQQNKRSYIILFWTKYFHKTIEYYLQNKTTIDGNYCSSVVPSIDIECVITSDRAYLSFSKALVFHWRDLSLKDLPPIRRTDQLWSLYNLESPTNTNNIFTDNDLHFNITSSYRQDSDIYVPYGRFRRRITETNPLKRTQLKTIDLKAKTKQIVWFVSNCETSGRRELYVRELSRFISVDVFGKCGPFACDPPRSHYCLQRVAKEYKFYLSFENSICRDYVTEKLFEALNYDIIPIVFGGSDYTSLLPTKSFIDGNRYTPKQLAQRLEQLSNNRDEYMSYFEWKTHYSVESGLDLKFEMLCHLCHKLNSRETYLSHTRDQLIDWWFNRAQCKTWISSQHHRNNYQNKYF